MKSNTPGFPLTLFGRHNVEPHGAPILGDSPLARGDAGHVDGRLRLKPGEYVLRLRLGQLPEGAAVLVDLGKERPNLGVDSRVVGGVLRCRGNVSHEACSCDQSCEFRETVHGGLSFCAI
jgi:hypothetical protein